MQPRSFLSPPVPELPPPLDARTLSVALARVPRVTIERPLRATTARLSPPSIVRLVRRVVRAAVAVAVVAVRFVFPRAQHVVAVSGARPPPIRTTN